MPADQLAVEHLDEDNYGVWSTHMEFLLTTKKCWRAVVATEELTSERDKETDQLARSYIGLTVKPQHLPTVKPGMHSRTSLLPSHSPTSTSCAKTSSRSQRRPTRPSPPSSPVPEP